MYICTFLENRARHLNIPSKIRTSKNVHNNIFSTFGHFENKLYLVTNSPHFFVFFFVGYSSLPFVVVLIFSSFIKYT